MTRRQLLRTIAAGLGTSLLQGLLLTIIVSSSVTAQTSAVQISCRPETGAQNSKNIARQLNRIADQVGGGTELAWPSGAVQIPNRQVPQW